MKRLIVVLLAIFIMILSLTSCSALYADRGGFVGGDVLDDKKMMEIRAEVIGSEITTEAEVVNNSSETKNEPEANTVVESDMHSTEEKTEAPTETETKTNAETVYWMSGGSVWHLDKDCRYIKGKEVKSGSQAEAIEAGKERACSSCSKK